MKRTSTVAEGEATRARPSHSIERTAMLTRYSAWANALLYASLAREPEATLSLDRNARPGGILGVLGHIYAIGLIWKAHLTGREHGFTTRRLAGPMPLNELQRLQADLDRWYVEFAETQSAESLAKDVSFVFVGGGDGVMQVDEMLLHVVNHSTYHRGYVADMLYESGSAPPTMDLPVYIRGVRLQGGARA
jgi:uncharacterized damage-inducible protein DinB